MVYQRTMLFMAYRYALDRDGAVRARLIADMAAGEHSLAELARRYGVSRQAVHRFGIRRAADIEAQRDDVAAAITDEWVTIKAMRIEAMREDLELIEGLLHPGPDGTGPDPGPDPDQVVRLLAAKRRHLRAIAEELGAIPKTLRVDSDVPVVTYRIEGVDLDRL